MSGATQNNKDMEHIPSLVGAAEGLGSGLGILDVYWHLHAHMCGNNIMSS